MRKLTWLGLMALLSLCAGCRARIHHGLEEREANAMQTALQSAGVEAVKVPESGKRPTWAIEVPQDEQGAAIRILESLGLPRRRLAGMARIMDASSMVPTPTEERLKETHLLAEQAVLALEQVEGVASAQVQLSLPPAPRAGQPRPPAKASALVKVRPGALPQVHPMRGALQALVAGGVDGLSESEVTIVLQELAAPRITTPLADGGTSTRLRWGLGLSASLVAALAVGLLLLVLRLRAARASLEELAKVQPAVLPARPRLATAEKRAP